MQTPLTADKYQNEEISSDNDQVEDKEDCCHQAIILRVESWEAKNYEFCDRHVAGIHYNSNRIVK